MIDDGRLGLLARSQACLAGSVPGVRPESCLGEKPCGTILRLVLPDGTLNGDDASDARCDARSLSQ